MWKKQLIGYCSGTRCPMADETILMLGFMAMWTTVIVVGIVVAVRTPPDPPKPTKPPALWVIKKGPKDEDTD